MRAWGTALLRETTPAVAGAFSLASTVLTFVPNLGLYRFRWVPLICLIGAFAWANFQAFEKQHAEIEQLQTRVAELQVRRAQLIIDQRGRSTFIVARERAESTVFDRIYVLLDLVIENRGSRTSNVNSFELSILGQSFSGLQPSYPRTVFGRRSTYAFSGTGPGADGHITIEAERMSDRIKLGFFVLPCVPTASQIDCTLTITDSEGSAASSVFHLSEG